MNIFNKIKITLFAGVVGLLATNLQVQAEEAPPSRPHGKTPGLPTTCPKEMDVKNSIVNEGKIKGGMRIQIRGTEFVVTDYTENVNDFQSGTPKTPHLEQQTDFGTTPLTLCIYGGKVDITREKETKSEIYSVTLVLAKNIELYKTLRKSMNQGSTPHKRQVYKEVMGQ